MFMVRPTDSWGIGAVMGVRDRLIGAIVGPDRELKMDLVEGSLLEIFLSARDEDGSAMSMSDVKAEILTAMSVPARFQLS